MSAPRICDFGFLRALPSSAPRRSISSTQSGHSMRRLGQVNAAGRPYAALVKAESHAVCGRLRH